MSSDLESGLDAPPAALVRTLARNEKSLAWVWRVATALAYFWLTSSFVSKSDYARDREARAVEDKALAVTLTKLDGTLSRYEDMRDMLKDHEARLRALERRPAAP